MSDNQYPLLYSHPKECCGCTACMAVCPQNAISMKENDEGFDYPYIDDDLCVGCLLCIKVCPFKSK